ncbi:voltage-gated potassium channel [Scopulibacillus darangshiensis]|uniref:Voltage-gated potassium channel n=1 Tax=Scopulibacillus darangshiensis TaxID=442528 RepID=A0A4R2NWQ1_9BACL|nr:potassium channel family protein [Scopulibacillus darangshiensis]TCP26593.1 voltage-gated potassium channel [Scopulibacillus darangshiensis]
MDWERLKSYYFRLPELLRLIIIILLLIVGIGIFMHIIEPNSFKTILDGIWWAVVTFATIGYGDFVPKTNYGKIISIFFIFLGAGFITYFLTKLAQNVMAVQLKQHQGKAFYKGADHMIIVGWNERASQLIKAIHARGTPYQIVLIDDSLDASPISNLQFVKGSSYEDETLVRANITQAKQLIITADPNRKEREADMVTIMTTLAAKGLHPDIYVIAEILTMSQSDNAVRAGVDELIHTSQITTRAISESLRH